MTVLLKKDPMYQEVYNRYTHCLENKQARYAAIAREMFERDHSSRLHASYKEGKLEGKLETARNLKNDGIPTAIIAKNTGLSVAEVERL